MGKTFFSSPCMTMHAALLEETFKEPRLGTAGFFAIKLVGPRNGPFLVGRPPHRPPVATGHLCQVSARARLAAPLIKASFSPLFLWRSHGKPLGIWLNEVIRRAHAGFPIRALIDYPRPNRVPPVQLGKPSRPASALMPHDRIPNSNPRKTLTGFCGNFPNMDRPPNFINLWCSGLETATMRPRSNSDVVRATYCGNIGGPPGNSMHKSKGPEGKKANGIRKRIEGERNHELSSTRKGKFEAPFLAR